MRLGLVAILAAVSLAGGCAPQPAPQPTAANATVYDCDGFELRVVRTDNAIVVETGGNGRTLRQSRQDALRYEGSGAVAVFAPNRTFVEWTERGITSACIADA